MLRGRRKSEDNFDEDVDMTDNGGSTDGNGTVSEPSTAMALRSGTQSASGRNVMHGETPIDWGLPYKVSPFLPTQNAQLVYRDSGTISVAANTDSTGIQTLQYRLNSIYDCKKTYSYVAQNAITAVPPTADAADGATIAKPTYRDYWAYIYNYWTCIGSRYTIKLFNNTTQSGNSNPCGIDVYVYENGRQNPPIMDAASTIVSHPYRMMHPNLKKLIRLPTQTYPGTGAFVSTKKFEEKHVGYWKNGSISHEVGEDELAQTWHYMDQVPPTPENLTIIFQQLHNGVSLAQSIKYEVIIEYCVQYKDLLSDIQYVTAATELPAFTPLVNPVTGS